MYIVCVVINHLQRSGCKTFCCDGGVYVVQYIHNLTILFMIAKIQYFFEIDVILVFFYQKNDTIRPHAPYSVANQSPCRNNSDKNLANFLESA